jgi:hypothetical protein
MAFSAVFSGLCHSLVHNKRNTRLNESGLRSGFLRSPEDEDEKRTDDEPTE